MQAFKSLTTLEYIHGVDERGWLPFPGRLWQRSYFDRVIRGEEELAVARRYVEGNPGRWEVNGENPDNIP